MGNLSPHLGNKDFFALETSVFSLQGFCGNSLAVKYGQVLLKEFCPLLLQKTFTFVTDLIHGA